MRFQPALSYAQASDGKERTQSETFDSSFRTSLHHLPQLRSRRVAIRWPQWGSLLDVWLSAESQLPGSTSTYNRPARRSWRPRLRGVWTSRDAQSPRQGSPLSCLRFGGSTHKLSMPRTNGRPGGCGHRQGGGGNPDAPSAPKKPEARDATAGRRYPKKTSPASYRSLRECRKRTR
jgi:hypothetical protein